MDIKLSVVIPLYNKEHEILRTLESVLSQRLLPVEIVVVDDGSTDGGPEVVESLHSPLIRLVSQPNSGVSVARNRGVQEAQGTHICLLDADDFWEPEYLEQVMRLITLYPNCGLYGIGFNVSRDGGLYPNETQQAEGIVSDFFRTSMTRHLIHTSSVTIPRALFLRAGGFPAGMKLGEDQYLWALLARDYAVCYSPRKLSTFNLLAENRSISVEGKAEHAPTDVASASSPRHRYQIEQSAHSLRDLYNPARADLNEFLSRCGIGKAIFLSTQGYTAQAKSDERFYRYTRTYRLGWWKLWTLNRLPSSWRTPLLTLYKRLSWLLSSKGKFEV